MPTIYILGYAFGPLVIAPLSELYGRLIVYIVCSLSFLALTIACALANSLSALIVFRLCAGIAASGPLALGPGTIADMTRREKRGKAMACWLVASVPGPSIGHTSGYCLKPQEDDGLTSSSWWLPCPSYGLASNILAHIHLGK